MTTISFVQERSACGVRMLKTALGDNITRYLEEPGVVEVMLNPDGRLWVDRLTEGLTDTGAHFSPERIEVPAIDPELAGD